LDRGVAYDHIAPNSRVGGRREHDDPVRVANRGVLLDQIVVAVDDADAEIVIGCREAISRRLVPPERVIVADDSYAAARGSCVGTAVSDGNIAFDLNPGRLGIHQNAGLTVCRHGDQFDLADERRCEQDAVRAKPLHEPRPANAHIGLVVRRDAVLVRDNGAATCGGGIGLTGDAEAVQP
jgi:hypothetical protein